MKKKFREFLDRLSSLLVDEDNYKKIIGFLVYAVLAVVSLFMTVVNVCTNQGILIWFTLGFGGLCIINCLLCLGDKTGVTIASIFLSLELLILFIFFLLFGYPVNQSGVQEGFSIIWICLLPSMSMLFYGRAKGSILSGIMFLVLIIFLWTPVGKMGNPNVDVLTNPEEYYYFHQYPETFQMRFPLLFFAFYGMSFILETLRNIYQKEIKKMTVSYKEISIRDQLTGVYNRKGLLEQIENVSKTRLYRKIGIIISDIDFFKEVNDTFGHVTGDKALQDYANMVTDNLNAIVCRWGGEEFAMIYYDDEVKCSDLENLRKKIEERVFKYDDIELKFTVSFGVYETSDHNLENFNEWVKKADSSLYIAKSTGRNKVVYY